MMTWAAFTFFPAAVIGWLACYEANRRLAESRAAHLKTLREFGAFIEMATVSIRNIADRYDANAQHPTLIVPPPGGLVA